MIDIDLNEKTAKLGKSHVRAILYGRVGLDVLHDETPANVVYAFYQRANERTKKRIERTIVEILNDEFVKKSRLKLDEELDGVLSDLAFACECIKPSEAYVMLRSVIDRGSVFQQKGQKDFFFFSKETEKRVLSALAVLQPPHALYSSVWKFYWESKDTFYWDVAFTGIRRCDSNLAVDLLEDGYDRWWKNKADFDFPQALFYLINQPNGLRQLSDISDSLAFLDWAGRDLLAAELATKGIAKETRERVLYETPPPGGLLIRSNRPFHIYYHSDMDGIGSCVLLIYYLREEYNLKLRENIELHPVDYDKFTTAKRFEIQKPAAVVDFLFHKDAAIWFDHHRDPFRSSRSQKDYETRQNVEFAIWDQKAPSAMSMIFSRFNDVFKTGYRDIYKKIKGFVEQVNKIDSGKYDSIDQWFNCTMEASKINLVLTNKRVGDNKYCNQLVRDLFRYGCTDIIRRPDFMETYVRLKAQMETDYEVVKRILEQYDGVIFYDNIKAKQKVFYRFFPYKFKPDSNFTVAIYRKQKAYEVSVGRNPWSGGKGLRINIGKMCGALGGGGHYNVGGITKGSYGQAQRIAIKMISMLGEGETSKDL